MKIISPFGDLSIATIGDLSIITQRMAENVIRRRLFWIDYQLPNINYYTQNKIRALLYNRLFIEINNYRLYRTKNYDNMQDLDKL